MERLSFGIRISYKKGGKTDWGNVPIRYEGWFLQESKCIRGCVIDTKTSEVCGIIGVRDDDKLAFILLTDDSFDSGNTIFALDSKGKTGRFRGIALAFPDKEIELIRKARFELLEEKRDSRLPSSEDVKSFWNRIQLPWPEEKLIQALRDCLDSGGRIFYPPC